MVFNLVFKHFNHILMYFVLCLKHLSNDTSNDSKCHILYFIFICNGLMILLNQSLIYIQSFLISWKYENLVTNMTWTILSLVFAAICLSLSMADEMKLLKNEIAVIRNLLREQNERLTRLEMENDALTTTVTKLENDNLLTRDRLVNISDKNKALKQEVSDLRRQVTTIQEDSNIENLDKQEAPSGAFRETDVHRKCSYQTTLQCTHFLIKSLLHRRLKLIFLYFIENYFVAFKSFCYIWKNVISTYQKKPYFIGNNICAAVSNN